MAAKKTRNPVIRIHLDQDELLVDNFAGGGGASSGVEIALGRSPIVFAFLVRYNGKGEPEALDRPLGTLTTRDRYGLVTVTVDGQEYVIVDIGMRMLSPRELFRAQGFRDNYDITAEGVLGAPLTKTAQVRMCGNSVPPPLGAAIVRAQFGAKLNANDPQLNLHLEEQDRHDVHVPNHEGGMKVTAESITEAQIRQLWEQGPVNCISGRDARDATNDEPDSADFPTSEQRMRARERCAAAWNKHFGANDGAD